MLSYYNNTVTVHVTEENNFNIFLCVSCLQIVFLLRNS